MKFELVVHAAAALTLSACVSGGVPGASQTPSHAEVATAKAKPEPESGPVPTSTSDKPDPKERTAGLLSRAKAACAKARSAVDMDGTEAAHRTFEQLSNCMPNDESCDDDTYHVKQAKLLTPVGVIAGRACGTARFVLMYATPKWVLPKEKLVVDAEKRADDALETAKQAVADRKAMEEAIKLEEAGVKAAFAKCAADKAKCREACEKGDHFHCLVRAEELAKANKYTEAKALYVNACEAKIMTACPLVEATARSAAKYAAEMDGFWKDVEQPGDDIASKRYLITFAQTKLPKTPKNLKATENVKIHVAAITSEQFCPAKKTFIAKGGLAEYQARAKAHCTEKAPIGTGLSGAQVTLTAECTAAFATACP